MGDLGGEFGWKILVENLEEEERRKKREAEEEEKVVIWCPATDPTAYSPL